MPFPSRFLSLLEECEFCSLNFSVVIMTILCQDPVMTNEFAIGISHMVRRMTTESVHCQSSMLITIRFQFKRTLASFALFALPGNKEIAWLL